MTQLAGNDVTCVAEIAEYQGLFGIPIDRCVRAGWRPRAAFQETEVLQGGPFEVKQLLCTGEIVKKAIVFLGGYTLPKGL